MTLHRVLFGVLSAPLQEKPMAYHIAAVEVAEWLVQQEVEEVVVGR